MRVSDRLHHRDVQGAQLLRHAGATLIERRFRPGETIARRNISKTTGAVAFAYALIVVRDDDRLFAGYRPPRATYRLASGKRGGPRGHRLLEWDGGWEERPFNDTDSLLELHRPGDAHSVYLFRNVPQDRVLRWYVNIEEPWRRSSLGFDSRDRLLDIVIEPDLSAWQWKDEDEVAEAVRAGTMTSEEVAALRDEGMRAVARLERRESPFGDGWDAWRPDPSWPMPVLPAGWSD